MRAEEIIVTIWKKKQEIIKRGSTPTRLVISGDDFKKVKEYKERLGMLDNPEMDYLQEDSIFGIPVFIDDAVTLLVE